MLPRLIPPDNEGVQVSVIIPVYDPRFLDEALESVAAQTYPAYEVIVVNDGAPNPGEVEQLMERAPVRYRYLRQENRGPSSARNRGIDLARGTFLAFLDADDCWDPAYLAEQLAALNRDPNLDLVYSDATFVGDSKFAGRRFAELNPSRVAVSCESLLREDCVLILSGVVAKKEAVVTAGLFDERFRHAEDFDLWLRMLKAGAHLAFQRQVLLRRRVHAKSLSYDILRHGEQALAVLAKFQERSDLLHSERAAVEWRIRKLGAELAIERAKRALAQSDFDTAIGALRTGNAFFRSWKLSAILAFLRISPALVARVHKLRGG